MIKFTDEVRLEAMRSGGFLPSDMPKDADPSFLLDWAIANGCCPAYWTEPKNLEETLANMPPKGNGLVLVKRGDRSRIDEYIKARL